MDVINRLLAMNVDVNHQLTRKRPYGAGRGRFADYDLRGGTGALFVAAMRQDHESMEALLAHGAEVDLPNVFQMTPLMVAVGMSGTNRGGGPEANDQDKVLRTVDLLLKAGADVNARVLNSRTHTAVLQSYIQGRDQEGRTALFAAAEGGRDKVVARLLESGADASVKDAAGKTALDAAKAPAPTGPGGPTRGAPGAKERAETDSVAGSSRRRPRRAPRPPRTRSSSFGARTKKGAGIPARPRVFTLRSGSELRLHTQEVAASQDVVVALGARELTRGRGQRRAREPLHTRIASRRRRRAAIAGQLGLRHA